MCPYGRTFVKVFMAKLIFLNSQQKGYKIVVWIESVVWGELRYRKVFNFFLMSIFCYEN